MKEEEKVLKREKQNGSNRGRKEGEDNSIKPRLFSSSPTLIPIPTPTLWSKTIYTLSHSQSRPWWIRLALSIAHSSGLSDLSGFMDPSPVFSRLHLHTAGTRKTTEEGKDNRWSSGLPDGPLLLSSSIVANQNRFDLLSLGCISEPEALGAHLSVFIVHPRPRSWMLTPLNPQSCVANSSFFPFSFLIFYFFPVLLYDSRMRLVLHDT